MKLKKKKGINKYPNKQGHRMRKLSKESNRGGINNKFIPFLFDLLDLA